MENGPRFADFGMKIELELMDSSGNLETIAVTIVSDQAADFSKGLLGENTLLAKTILGKTPGIRLGYKMGDLVAVQITQLDLLDVEPSQKELIDRRQAEAERIQREIAKTNAANFASSFSGKWGDYDPDGLKNWEK